MTVRLDKAQPPLREVARLPGKASAVYNLMWSSAAKDNRGYCGGTTHWSVAGIASEINAHRNTVVRALDALLDEGFITVIGLQHNRHGKPSRVYRVIHPDHLEAQRHAIGLFTDPPSVRQAKIGGNTNTEEDLDFDSDLPSEDQNFWPDEI